MESDAPPIARELLWLPGERAQRPGAAPVLSAPISHPGALELLAIVVRSHTLPVGGLRAPELRVDGAQDAAWRRLLFDEPGLAAWTVCRAQQSGRALATVALASEWLASHALREFSCWADGFAGRPPGETERPAECSFDSLAAASAAWAKVAVSAGLGRLAAEAYSQVARSDAVDRDSVRPDNQPWLGYLRAIFGGPLLGIASNTTSDAPAPAWLLDHHEPVPVLAAIPPANTIDAITSAANDRWLSPPSDGSWVPQAMQKLAWLATLESQFADSLQTEKLAAMKELAYGAGHEINNPLANISARAQTLLQDERDPERRRRLAAINAQAFRAHEMIADLMLFARPPQPKLARIDMNELVRQVVASLDSMAAEQQTAIHFQPSGEPLIALADAVQLAVAVRALGVNALESLDQGGEVRIAACAVSEGHGDPEGDAVRITVADSGPGIAPELAPRLFDPFFSGREAGRGLGFGLTKCWRIVTNHGGRIESRNRPEGGALFTIHLPRFASLEHNAKPAATPSDTAGL